jgi:preprotein translocase subunit SecG
MGTVLIILHVVVCTFLILVVLLQSGKGGGMGAIGGGGGSGSVFGGRGASTFLSKTTAVMAGLFMLFSVLLTLVNFSDDLEAAARERSEAQKKATEPFVGGSENASDAAADPKKGVDAKATDKKSDDSNADPTKKVKPTQSDDAKAVKTENSKAGTEETVPPAKGEAESNEARKGPDDSKSAENPEKSE